MKVIFRSAKKSVSLLEIIKQEEIKTDSTLNETEIYS